MNNGANIAKGIGSGFVATIVLSAIMLMKQTMGHLPQFDPIQMITEMNGMGTPFAGWLMHFFIGTILWGVLYVWLDRSLPGPRWFRGATFATGAWLLMMILMMPMAGGRALRLAHGDDGADSRARYALDLWRGARGCLRGLGTSGARATRPCAITSGLMRVRTLAI